MNWKRGIGHLLTKLGCWSFEGTKSPVKSEKQKLPQVMERMRKKEGRETLPP